MTRDRIKCGGCSYTCPRNANGEVLIWQHLNEAHGLNLSMNQIKLKLLEKSLMEQFVEEFGDDS